MNSNKIIVIIVFFSLLIFSCKKNNLEKKGFQVTEIVKDENGEKILGLKLDSLKLETQPRNVLFTNIAEHRLTPIYKVNYHKKTNKPFTGSNSFHNSWQEIDEFNNWNNNFMPGFETVYGYNFVNVSHYNNLTNEENTLFENPVLIKNLYYPTLSKDTLNNKPVHRNFYMVSVYDEDTNKDGFINAKDLRRLYYFDINGLEKRALVPLNYSVMNSEYDYVNDFMYVFAKIDENNSGRMEVTEPTHIYWIDLKEPSNLGLQYKPK